MTPQTTERPDNHGITDADRAQIRKYLQKHPHHRRVDDLRPGSKR